ncbi:MAG: hypothetical protein GF419_06505 [Ignavibacteriales bacterium]|nr:hypothetical protein [Ignavibacteriales bacterium]
MLDSLFKRYRKPDDAAKDDAAKDDAADKPRLVRVDDDVADSLEDAARREGRPPDLLANQWLREKLNERRDTLEGSSRHDREGSAPAIALTKALDRFGPSLASDGRRLRAILNDMCGEKKRGVNLLMAARDAGAPEEIARLDKDLDYFDESRIAARVAAESGVEPDAARWSVRRWADALGGRDPRPKANDLDEADYFAATTADREEERFPPKATGAAIATALAFSADGAGLAAGCENGDLLRWETRGPAEGAIVRAATSPVTVATHSLDGEAIVANAGRGEATIWRTADSDRATRLAGFGGDALSAAISPDGVRVTLGGKRGKLAIFDAERGAILATRPAKGTIDALALGFSHTGRYLAATDDDGAIFLDASTLAVVRRFALGAPASAIAFSPSENRLAFGLVNGELRHAAFDADATLLGKREGRALAAAFTPNGETIATIDATGAVSTQALGERKRRVGALPAYDAGPVALSPDARLCAWRSGNRRVLISLVSSLTTDLR